MAMKNRGFEWIKEHRKELFWTGVGVAATVGFAILVSHYGTSLQVENEIIDTKVIPFKVPDCCTAQEIIHEADAVKMIDVKKHLRDLPVTWNASPEKIATAAEHGYDLAPHQTWVVPHTRICA